LDTPSYGALVE